MKIIYSLILWIISADLALSVTQIPSKAKAGESIPTFGQYYQDLFPTAVQLVAGLAVLTIAYWGLMYMMSNIPGVKGIGKERIWSALGGLILALSAWLILKTVNPQILDSINSFMDATVETAAKIK